MLCLGMRSDGAVDFSAHAGLEETVLVPSVITNGVFLAAEAAVVSSAPCC